MQDQASPSLTSTTGTARTPELAAGMMTGAVAFPAGQGDETSSPVQSVARRAVDTAINIMEIQAGQRGRNLSTVNVRMKLAGEDLSIRVELRGGEVRTSFHTASPDLRNAISQEWQIVATESPHRILRFHEPEFSGVERSVSDRGSSEQQARDGNAAREHAQGRREAGAEHNFHGRTAAAATPGVPVSTAIAEVFAPGSLHLSTFA